MDKGTLGIVGSLLTGVTGGLATYYLGGPAIAAFLVGGVTCCFDLLLTKIGLLLEDIRDDAREAQTRQGE